MVTSNKRLTRTPELMWPRLYRHFEGGSRTLQGQLRDMLVHAVMEGYLSPGEALPSSRLLAQMLDLSRTTVTLALHALADKGLIVGKARSGYYVSHELQATYIGARQRSDEPASANTVQWCNRIKSKPSLQRNIQKPLNWQSYPYPFIYGQFDSTLFPNADWRECVLESSQTRGLRRWAPDSIDQDDGSLIEQIHRRLLPARGIWAERDQILVTAGAQQAMFLLTMLLMGPNTVVGVENPGYPDARNTLALRTKQVRALKVDQHGLCVTTNLSQCQYVYVTPSHQCPTTVTMPLDRRMELLDRAARDDIIFIEDDHESELNFSGNPTPALKSLDTLDRVIYLGSLSKTLAHGLRLGYIVAPAELIQELRALRRLVMRHVPNNNQLVAASFIAHGHQDAFVRRLNVAYKERAHILRHALSEYAPMLRPVSVHGGSALWVSAPKQLDTRALAERLYEKGVIVEPGDIFFAAKRPPLHHVRIGYSSIPKERIEEGVRIIARELKQLLTEKKKRG